MQPNTTLTEQSQHYNNKKHFIMSNVINYQTDAIDDDNDDSSSINNDYFQFISHDALVLFDNIISVPEN